MSRKLGLLILAFVLLSRQLVTPTAAQSFPQALTHYALTVYSGPDRTASIIGVLNPRAKVILEARNIDTTWVLGHSTDGLVRGWMESRFLDIDSGVSIPGLLFSNEMIFISTYTSPAAVYRTIKLTDYPVLPASMERAREIYESGRIHQTDSRVVSKIGDCITDNARFLTPFGTREFNLGGYGQLLGVINYFSDSLAYDSLAAYDGLVTSAALDPIFANPQVCLPGESPLRCEYRVHNPSVALIMFGAQDVLFTPAEDFDRNLRHIVHETIQAGIVPVLSTFPGNLERWEESIELNQIVVQIAVDYDLPLINLWLALESLPNHGLNNDGRHLSVPITHAGDLTGDNLRRGYTLRNLITLQALDALWRDVMAP